MSDRQEMLSEISECLERDVVQALQHHRIREVEGWELAAGYWPFVTDLSLSDAEQALRQFDEILNRGESTMGQIVIDSCAMEYGQPTDERGVRRMRGVGLWLRPMIEDTDAS